MRTLLLLPLLLLSTLAEARPVRVCFIGDSITEAFSPATIPSSRYLRGLHATQDFGVKNVADAGDTVADAAALLASECLGRGYTHVVLAAGTNDLATSDAATIYAAIDAMADLVEAEGAEAILHAVLPRATYAGFTATIESRRTTLNASLSARVGSTYVDVDTPLRGTASGTAWAGNTAYSLNNVRINDSGKAYVCTTAGTSAASGGPTGTGTGITDGTAVWSWVPALGTEYGGGTDGLHPNDAGELRIAKALDCAGAAAGFWVASADSGC